VVETSRMCNVFAPIYYFFQNANIFFLLGRLLSGLDKGRSVLYADVI
jgi:hypothetical protein